MCEQKTLSFMAPAEAMLRYGLSSTAVREVTPAQLAEADWYAYGQRLPVSSEPVQAYLTRLIAYGWRPWGSDPQACYNKRLADLYSSVDFA